MKIKRIVSILYEDFYPFQSLVGLNHPYADGVNMIATSNPEDITKDDAIIVWGGSDISPDLYKKKKSTYSGAGDGPSRRDEIEWACMQRAIEIGAPIIGICRGAQMLCAAAGGYLIQHVDNHAGRNHAIKTATGETLKVNSLHHQMLYPFEVDHELLAWSAEALSRVYHDEDRVLDEIKCEPELVVFNSIKGIAAQWHPETMHETAPATEYLMEVIKEKVAGW